MNKYFLLFLLLNAYQNSYAQIVLDGTMGNTHYHGSTHQLIPHHNKDTLANQFTISPEMGTTINHNLFHSFQTFNIKSGETAVFTGDNSLNNVFARVTGGSVSTINGALNSTINHANFYFINPAGIVFGKGASVNVPMLFI
ncbi:MAG: filamentous hemagglutinin N-terminal domain-containing protein [Methylococcaceae bacterium]